MGPQLRRFALILLVASVVAGWLVHWGWPLSFSPVVESALSWQLAGLSIAAGALALGAVQAWKRRRAKAKEAESR